MRVTATRRGVMIAQEIDERKRTGLGYTLEAAEIQGRGSFVTVLRDLPAAHVRYSGTSFYVEVNGPSGRMCTPAVWLDGAVSAYAALNMLHPTEVQAVEFFPRASTLPHKYMGNAMVPQCGAILVWTRWAFGGTRPAGK
jgi:hypothetical protein